jgi:hypothetical protein
MHMQLHRPLRMAMEGIPSCARECTIARTTHRVRKHTRREIFSARLDVRANENHPACHKPRVGRVATARAIDVVCCCPLLMRRAGHRRSSDRQGHEGTLMRMQTFERKFSERRSRIIGVKQRGPRRGGKVGCTNWVVGT